MDGLTVNQNANDTSAADADAAAIEKFDKAADALNPGDAAVSGDPQGDPATADGELDVPDKFKGDDGDLDVQKLLKSYKELEAVRSKPDAADSPPDTDNPAPEGGDDKDGDKPSDGGDSEVVQTILDKAGVSADDAQKAILDTGDLTEEQYAAFEKQGLPRDLVSRHVKMLKGEADAYERTIKDAAGGADAWDQMVQWASTGWDKKTIANFNAAMQAGEEHAVPWVEHLKKAYTAANGSGTGGIMSGNGDRVDTGGRFESYKQVTAAMKDPRYKTDPAYRNEVDAKLARSPI